MALTRVDSDGTTHPLGYVSLPFREAAAQAIPYELGELTALEAVDLVLAEMHPDLPSEIDAVVHEASS